MNRLSGIQLLRGLAAFVVVLFHIGVLSNDYAGGVLYAPFMLVGSAGVDLFFVISGFVMAATTADVFDTRGAAARFAVHRFARVYPSYWLLLVPLLAFYLLNPAGVNSKQGGVDLWASFLLTPSPYLPLLPVAWTLVHEVAFYAVFFFAIWLLPRRLLPDGLGLWAGLILVHTAVVFHGASAGLDSILLHPFNLEFIAGAAIGLAYRRHGAMPAARCRITVAAAAVCFVAVSAYLQTAGWETSVPPLGRVPLFGVPSVLAVAGMSGLAPSRVGWQGFFTRMGDYSYSLYLTHILLIHLAYRVLARKLGIALTLPTNLALAVALILACVAAGWCYWRLIEKPACAWVLRWLSRRVLGNGT